MVIFKGKQNAVLLFQNDFFQVSYKIDKNQIIDFS